MTISFDGLYCWLSRGDGHEVDLVVVDRFSKYAMFISIPNAYLVDVVADLIFRHVMKLFGYLKTSLVIKTHGVLVNFGRPCLTCWVHI